ncbi:MAG: transcription-repair coupling factor, partial [Gammaproteobacteria bacterium]|nr:transcription-repair coupling factor [Gammaproteobacteria bacterium]
MSENYTSPLSAKVATQPGQQLSWGRLYGSSYGLAIAGVVQKHPGLLLILTADTQTASRLEYELRFYLGQEDETPILHFPDWETLPYDNFSPHQDITSERLSTLYQLPTLERGILILPVTTLMHRLPPREYIEASGLRVDVDETLALDSFRQRLERSGYHCVSQVMEHGEFAVRGSLIDLFPMGSPQPYRIELFDDEVESIRTFDPESQRSDAQVTQIQLLSAHEFPLNEEAIKLFRQNYREQFEGDPQRSVIYRDISQGLAPSGIEYYLPLFFEQTHTLFDYLPANTLLLTTESVNESIETFWQECNERYEMNRHDIERPLLPPRQMFLEVDET